MAGSAEAVVALPSNHIVVGEKYRQCKYAPLLRGRNIHTSIEALHGSLKVFPFRGATSCLTTSHAKGEIFSHRSDLTGSQNNRVLNIYLVVLI